MIHYSPIDGDPRNRPIQWRPKTVFVMQQLRAPIPGQVIGVRKQIDRALREAGFTSVDATNRTTGKDYLLKIWEILLGCPVGIAIVHEDISPATLANIYYEMGLLQAYGRETLVVKIGAPDLPSDFIRTEYVEAGSGFPVRLREFIDALRGQADHYLRMADLVERNPLLAIDYLRRASLLNGDRRLGARARGILHAAGMGERSLASVEEFMLDF